MPGSKPNPPSLAVDNSDRRAPPTVGEHSDEVLRVAGYTDTEIRALRAEGVIIG